MLKRFIDRLFTRLINRFLHICQRQPETVGLDFGPRVTESGTSARVAIPHRKRAESIVILGKTGTGKSSLLRYIAQQDIEAGRGFLYFDIHGDASSFLIKSIAQQ